MPMQRFSNACASSNCSLVMLFLNGISRHRRISLFGKLRPDFLPVVGAQIAAGYLSSCNSFNGSANGGIEHITNTGRLAHVALSGAAIHGKRLALSLRQRVEVFDESFHVLHFTSM